MAVPVQDGCYAWAVCAASFLVLLIQGGLLYSMGIFYIMFKQGLDAGDGALSLVTSLNYGIMCLVGPFVGILTEKYGERPLAISGAFISAVGLACSSFTSEPYQLYLGYSLIAGIGFGMVLNTCISILEKYFKKYIKVASGLIMCGSGVGSFIFPPIIKALEDKYGWRGALLLIAGIYSHIILFSCLYRPVKAVKGGCDRNSAEEDKWYVGQNTLNLKGQGEYEVKEELTELKETTAEDDLAVDQGNLENKKKGTNLSYTSKPDSKSFELHSKNVLYRVKFLFKSRLFLCLCLHTMLTQFPTILVYTHLGNYILTLGFTKSNVVTVYVIIGITITIARASFGILAEFTGASPSILITASTMMNGILTILLPFVFTQNLTLIYVYGVLFSIMLAPDATLTFPIIVESVHKSQVATGNGVVCFFCVPGSAFGAPFAAWLYGYTGLYSSSFYLAGGLFVLSTVMMIPAICQKYVKCHREGL